MSPLPLALLAGLLAIPGAPRAAPTLQPPTWTRARMEAHAAAAGPFRIVYGTRDAATAAALRERAVALGRRWFGDSARVLADRDASAAQLAAGPVLLVGAPRENSWTQAFAPALPLAFTPGGFRWRGTAYERPGDALALAWPNPCAPRTLLLLLAANTPAALPGRAGLLGAADWRIDRGGERARWGTFAQEPAAPWRYDPALDHDREAARGALVRALHPLAVPGVAARAVPGVPGAGAAAGAAAALLARLDAMGLAAPGGRPTPLALVGTLEDAALLAGEARQSGVSGEGGAVLALGDAAGAPDLDGVAAARLVALGARRESRLLEPAAAWIANAYGGEGLARAVARAYFGRELPTAEAAATRAPRGASPLVWTPARALLVRAAWECAPAATRRGALLALLRHEAPATLDSLCAAAGVGASRVAARYRVLADSLAHEGQRSLAWRQAIPWRAADGFMDGVALAHAPGLEAGYASRACGRELGTLRAAGATWIALAPLADLGAGATPELRPASAALDDEGDDAVIEALRHARALGLRAWLVPRLWWPGAPTPFAAGTPGWNAFFDQYRDWLLHWALVAERERADGLCVGRDLPAAIARDPARWSALVAELRTIFPGALTYVTDARDAAQVPFWGALDVIGVALAADAAAPADVPRSLDALLPLARRAGRPVLVFASPTGAASGEPGTAERERAIAAAIATAVDSRPWVAGVLWEPWPSSPGAGPGAVPGALPASGAAGEVQASIRRWRSRRVDEPAP